MDANIPPLLEGDRLTRDEFERRYNNMPHLKRAELIDGLVRLDQWKDIDHGSARAALIALIGNYCCATPRLRAAAHLTVRLDAHNEPQPDVCVRLPVGRSFIDTDGFVAGAPEFIGEVVPDNSAYALHSKLHAFRRAGVQEYLVWRVRDAAVDWFALRGDEYERLEINADGVIRSEVLPGLWVDCAALVQLDIRLAFDRVTQGTNTDQHTIFVARLASLAK